MKKEVYEILIKITRIDNRAVKKAQGENRSRGLPNVYSKNKRFMLSNDRLYKYIMLIQ